MKLQEVFDLINEESAGKVELKGKEDLARVSGLLITALKNKGFTPENARNIISQFIQQLNSSGWMNKILANDENTPDISVDVDGSDVHFLVISDSNPRDRKTFEIKGVKQEQVFTPPKHIPLKRSTAIMKPQTSSGLSGHAGYMKVIGQ